MTYRYEEALYGRLTEFKPFSGYTVTVAEGCGKYDPGRDAHGICRSVTYWFTSDGFLIRKDDPHEGSE